MPSQPGLVPAPLTLADNLLGRELHRDVEDSLSHISARGNGGPPSLGNLTIGASPRNATRRVRRLELQPGPIRPRKGADSGCCGTTPGAGSASSSWRWIRSCTARSPSSRSRPQHADDPTSRARFLLEAEVTGRLEHPGVVPVYGLGTNDQGRPFYAMRFVRGESLKEAIDELPPGRSRSPAATRPSAPWPSASS